jgi:1,4-alpha-glucan branching enzyme
MLSYMWAHPGKKLIFMGGEFGQEREWDHDRSLDWHLLDDPMHAGLKQLMSDMNRAYKKNPALWELDHEPEGFQWIDANDADNNVISFYRTDKARKKYLVCISNLSPVPRSGFRVGLPTGGSFREVLNTDAESYGGTNVGNMGKAKAEKTPWHGLDHSAMVTLPPLGTIWLEG